MIRDSSSFPSSRNSVVGVAVGDVVVSNTVVAASKGSLQRETLVCATVRNLDLTKMSLKQCQSVEKQNYLCS